MLILTFCDVHIESFFRVEAYLVIDHLAMLDQALKIVGPLDVDVHAISCDVIEFVNVQAVPRIGDNIKQKRLRRGRYAAAKKAIRQKCKQTMGVSNDSAPVRLWVDEGFQHFDVIRGYIDAIV